MAASLAVTVTVGRSDSRLIRSVWPWWVSLASISRVGSLSAMMVKARLPDSTDALDPPARTDKSAAGPTWKV